MESRGRSRASAPRTGGGALAPRPAFARYGIEKKRAPLTIPTCLRVVAEATFEARGAAIYRPEGLLRRPLVALRGGADGIALAFRVAARGVSVRVLARGSCDREAIDGALDAARGLAAVDDDPTEFVESLRGSALASLARRVDVRLPRAPTLFEAFASAVIEQLVTSYEARMSIRRLFAHAGEAILDTRFRAAPTAAAVAAVPMWKLHEMGVGARRAVTLHQGAKRGAALERLRGLTPDVALEKLQSLRGIGPWTANLVVRNAFGWADAVPVGDFHAPRLVTEMLTGERDGTDATMLAALEPHRPHRARVVVLVEHGAMASRTGPLPRVDRHRRQPWRY